MTDEMTVAAHFADKPLEVRAAYDALLAALRTFGPVHEAPKQTSIHLEKNSGFAGVHPRKNAFNLEFRTDSRIDHPRISRVEQHSARRFMHTVRLEKPSDVDDELLGWLRLAYELAK